MSDALLLCALASSWRQAPSPATVRCAPVGRGGGGGLRAAPGASGRRPASRRPRRKGGAGPPTPRRERTSGPAANRGAVRCGPRRPAGRFRGRSLPAADSSPVPRPLIAASTVDRFEGGRRDARGQTCPEQLGRSRGGRTPPVGPQAGRDRDREQRVGRVVEVHDVGATQQLRNARGEAARGRRRTRAMYPSGSPRQREPSSGGRGRRALPHGAALRSYAARGRDARPAATRLSASLRTRVSSGYGWFSRSITTRARRPRRRSMGHACIPPRIVSSGREATCQLGAPGPGRTGPGPTTHLFSLRVSV